MPKRILIVDDEPDICDILRVNLEMDGYEVDTAEAPPILNGNLPDLILLDVMMTPKSGFEWARELKADALTRDIPIIFCTAKTAENDMLEGFSLGSDDYVCKPFRIAEVKARVRAALMRHRSTPAPTGDDVSGNVLRHEGLVLNKGSRECTIDGTTVPFTKLEFEVLWMLMSSPGQVFSRQTILHAIWPGYIVTDRTVDVNIARIRKKLGPYSPCLQSRFGYGYMFKG